MAKATKAQKAALRRAKERSAKRDKREPLTPHDIKAIEAVCLYKALLRQGMTRDEARWMVQETVLSEPIIPRVTEGDNFDAFDDEEEEED